MVRPLLNDTEGAVLYQVVLILHSWLRWAVLAFALVTLARSFRGARAKLDWTGTDQRMHRLFVASLDTQVLLGLLLYFVLSPLTPRSLDTFRNVMPVAYLRFFAVEHITAMVLAVVIAHVSSVRARRAATAPLRHRRVALGTLGALIAVLVGIPWPGLPYARPLFRLPW